jgi:integrase
MPRKALPPRLKQFGATWYVVFSDDGRSQRDSLRTEDLQVAQQRFQGWLKSRDEDRVARTPQTLANAYRLYIDQHGPITESPKTLEYVSRKAIVWFGDRLLTDISRTDIENFATARLEGAKGWRPVTRGTVRKELTILRAVFNFMVRRVEPKECRVNLSELAYIPLPSHAPPRDRVLSDAELERIRAACRALDDERIDRISRYLWLLMETGARSGALRTLKWDQIDLQSRLLRLNPWGRNQTNKRRPIIPISDDLLPVLERAHREKTTAWVLDHSGEIRKSMIRFCERYEIHGATAHTFRHTLATRMAQAGVDMRDIAAMLGDSIATVEKNYLHLSPQYLRGALNKLKASGTAQDARNG